jgi:hypothetical protein
MIDQFVKANLRQQRRKIKRGTPKAAGARRVRGMKFTLLAAFPC